ncbi:hypothetical protein T07_3750 [Trichinella nelsoni]|uniref:Uncharacterized protein n=1 Tax=Trichinella nelsoni TaxID=6336 RepID=A0A0V0SAQ2_9BILA|nr:hypothetical protein T07_3750 [Trichinella nelsoni]
MEFQRGQKRVLAERVRGVVEKALEDSEFGNWVQLYDLIMRGVIIKKSKDPSYLEMPIIKWLWLEAFLRRRMGEVKRNTNSLIARLDIHWLEVVEDQSSSE